MPDDGPEASSFLSEAPLSDVYGALYVRDPYAAFDPEVSAASEDDNHELAESGSTQSSFKKIGEQWAAMVTSHSTDNGRSTDGRSPYAEEQSVRRDVSHRRNRHKNRSGWRRSAATRSPSELSPESSVQDEAVGTTPRVVPLVSEEVQTAVDDSRLSSQVAEENCLTSRVGIVHGTVNTQIVVRDMVDEEVQCPPKTTDLIKKEFMRLAMFCVWFAWCIT